MCHRLPLGNRDCAILPDLLKGIGDHLAYDDVAVGRDGRHLTDLLWPRDRLGLSLQIRNHSLHRRVNAALQVHRVHTRHDCLRALAKDSAGEHSRCGSSITCDVVCLRRDLLDERRTAVHSLVLEFYCLGDGDAVLGNLRCTKALLDDNVATLRPQCHRDSISQSVGAQKHRCTCGRSMADLLRSKTARRSTKGASDGRSSRRGGSQHRQHLLKAAGRADCLFSSVAT
mmetsp:Transcript_42370/g.92309  ORF Transcript_42370/g.92309 Transcript_42370/m.92309 type:complete len:228 (+) Transcript_42370:1075-1758(+)